ncbi:hypothetical protein [Lacticaseibacillus porcinae]|uniref:hypothetical protein n=1 Tax=Lacticaseibacillus porcinae TaxID=1123687 RepID=UPI000F7A3AAB|nr:hypothetical protein [Lacticaseibacillus porcinae]
MDKQTLDLDDCVIAYISSHVELPAPLEMGRQDGSGASVVYVMEPTKDVKRYFNGRVKRDFAFTIMTKLEKWRDSAGLLDRINGAMEDAKRADIKSNNGSFEFISASMTNSPAYRDAVEDDGVTYSIYAASFKVTAVIN